MVVDEDKEHAARLFASCFNELRRLAEQEEDAEAAFILYSCYDDLSTESFLDADADHALEWLELSAQLKYPDAMYWLGIALAGGTLLPILPDTDEAIALFEESASMGFIDAMVRLGDHYYYSDPDKAKSWYKNAINRGNTDAAICLVRLESGKDLI